MIDRQNVRIDPCVGGPSRWRASFFFPGWDVCSIHNVDAGYFDSLADAIAAAKAHELYPDESYQLTITPIPASAFRKRKTGPTCGAER